MKTTLNSLKKMILTGMIGSFFLISTNGFAQRRDNNRTQKGERSTQARPQVKSRPGSNTRPATSRPSVNDKISTINKPVNGNRATMLSNTPTSKIRDKKFTNNKAAFTPDRNNKTGNKTTNTRRNTVNRSQNNVTINVNNNVRIRNNRNTIVRRNTVVYARPAYRYGGYRYYVYHPYYYHPYRPYYWGPVWHPWGFFATTLAVTAIVVNVQSTPYHYDQGVWYASYNGGYEAVPAPVGGVVYNIPDGAQTVYTGTVNNYYYGGTYYEKDGSTYRVVAPTAGTLVDSLPEGGEEVTIGDVKYIKFGETYYQPVQVDGKDKYEVVLVEEDK